MNDLDIRFDIWDEYKYRHDLIWRKVHQFTIIMVLLGTAPHINFDLEQLGKYLIQLLPIIGTLFGIFGLLVLKNELFLFTKIKIAYKELQNKFMKKVSEGISESKIPIPFHINNNEVSCYFWVYYCSILFLSFLNCVILFIWKFCCIINFFTKFIDALLKI